MTDYAKYPFVRMLIPFVLGIWCYVCLPSFRFSPSTTIIIASMLFAMASMTALVIKSYQKNWVFGAVMGCYLALTGYAMEQVHEAKVQKSYFRNFETDAYYYVARVYDYPTERPNAIRTVLDLEYQFGDSLPSRPVSGKVMAYFPKSDSAFALSYGDLIAVPAPIREVTPPLNPEEFDYRAFLARKGIMGQVYLKDEDWIDLQTNNANPIYAFSYRFRDVLLTSLQRSGLSDNEFGVAAAILLGYDDNLADEVRKNYVAAGSMHILCVSGMHVGIIYLLASFLLGFLNRKKWQKTLKHGLLLALIWFYALIAGLSPSILRASLMISFVIVGEMIRRKGFIINSSGFSLYPPLYQSEQFVRNWLPTVVCCCDWHRGAAKTDLQLVCHQEQTSRQDLEYYGGSTFGTNRDDPIYFVLFQSVHHLFLVEQLVHDSDFVHRGHQRDGIADGVVDSLSQHLGRLPGLGCGVCDELGGRKD